MMRMTSTVGRIGRARRRRLAGLVLVGAIAPVTLAACGDDDESGSATTTAVSADDAGATDGADAAGVEVTGAWSRNSPTMAATGAAYMTITSTVDDRLVGAAVDPSIAGVVEIHETVMSDMSDDDMSDDDMSHGDMSDGDMSDGDMGGAMTMQPVDGFDLPAGEAVSLEPGGLHVMLLDLAAPLEVGQTYELTLTFEQAGEQTVTVEVREDAP